MAYTPTTWSDGDVITAEKLNKLEQGVKNEQVGPAGPAGAVGENVTKAEFKALLDALKAAGQMASK